MDEYVLKAEVRDVFGTRPMRRLRVTGKLPAILYGHKQENVALSLDAKEFRKFFEAGHRFATIEFGSVSEPGLIKAVQYDAFGTTLIHVDFARVSTDEKIEVEVAVELVGAAKGLAAGGILDFSLKEILVEGFPRDLPERYPINVEALDLDQSIRIRDLTPPANCSFGQDPETVVVAVVRHQVEAVVAPAEGEPTQPEVITRKKEEPPESEAKK